LETYTVFEMNMLRFPDRIWWKRGMVKVEVVGDRSEVLGVSKKQ
jgi:hypothetical protein